MKPEEIKKPGDIFKFLAEQQIKMQKVQDSVNVEDNPCVKCFQIFEERLKNVENFYRKQMDINTNICDILKKINNKK